MTVRTKRMNRILSAVLCLALLLVYVPVAALRTFAAAADWTVGVVADPGTAHTFETAMGTVNDGNRYAGRVWVDRSAYTNGQTVLLNTRGEANSSFKVALEDDEVFQVVFSALGSSMSSTATTSVAGPIDVVLVLDTSTSMDEESKGVTRFERVITAANKLLDDLLSMKNVRVAVVTYNADSETVLPLDAYENGVQLSVNNYYYNSRQETGVVTAKDKSGKVLGQDDGFTTGTNLQAGIDRGFNILAEATDVARRIPVAIVLTDGQANRASKEGFYEISSHQDADGTNASNRNLYLSTLLNAAYNKTKIEANYGRKATVYTIGVDITNNTTAKMLMDPANSSYGFNAQNSSSEVKAAYTNFQKWAQGQSVTESQWTFDHNYPTQNGLITDEKIAANINYADVAYDVSGADVNLTFDQIYEELSSNAFNPITGSTSIEGSTGVDGTPLIYVDFIGQHMEVKEITNVTLFGASYGVLKNADGTYTVEEKTGINPTTKEAWNTAQDIKISITRQEDGTQKLEIRISQEILPIMMEHIDSSTVGDQTVSTITETKYDPLRVYYTIGLDSSILLPNGEVDVTKLLGYTHIDDAAGTISFYGSQFGEVNPAVNGVVTMGDSHVGFQPSAENRYYYHQSNQGIFTGIDNKTTGEAVAIPENTSYGIEWDDTKYELTHMSYNAYLAAQDDDTVYTSVTYYRPTASTSDAANAAEEVTYLVYTSWGYLKESVAFYDATTGKYINYDAQTGTYSSSDVGYTMSKEAIAAYVSEHPEAEIYAVLGVGSLRTSRLHNMVSEKENNVTGTATQSFTPCYTYETAKDHNDNSVVVWLGNNGKLTVNVDTGIALTKSVTETIGNADDIYDLTVTLPAGTDAQPVVKDINGNVVSSSYANAVLTVGVKAGQTVYITGIPAGTVCRIDEEVRGDYYVASKTAEVTVPSLSQVLAGTHQQYAAANVTNAPNKYGSLTVVKDVSHNLTSAPEAMAQKVFSFKVQLPTALAGQVFNVNKENASAFSGNTVTVGSDGSFVVSLKDNESITILDLPVDTAYTVTEISNVAGYTDMTGSVNGVIVANRDAGAHFVNAYQTTPVQIQVTVTGQKHLSDLHETYTGNEDFVFILSRYVGVTADNETGYVELARQTAKAGGRYSFDLGALVQTLDLGTHYFRVTEDGGNTAGMTYDATRGLFAVVVTDENADGTLEYTVEDYANTQVAANGGAYTVTKDFTNIYNVEMTYADINITKLLNNTTGVAIPLDTFRFQLLNSKDITAAPVIATTDASGKATIRISNLKEGTYAYTLQEINGGMVGMQYDNTVYSIVVEVTKSGSQLQAVVHLEGQQGIGNSITLAFENTYSLSPVTHSLSGKKVLTGPKSIADGDFSFAIFETDATFAAGSVALEEVQNVGGDFSFSEMTYTKVGTYYYVIEEVAGNQAGMTYDATHYHVTVTVGIDPENAAKLAVTNVSINKIGVNSDTTGSVVFVNHYAVTETTHSLSGTKLLRGRAMSAREFTFELYEGDRLLESVTNKADGSFGFSHISYTAAGVYTYTVKEVKGTAPGVEYVGAEKPVTVVVTVEDVDSLLQVTKTEYLDVDGQPVSGIVFENVYTATQAQVLFQGVKTLVGGQLQDGAFTFKLYKTNYTFDISGADAQCLDVQTNKDGAFAFDPMTFQVTGTFFYAIVEDALVNPDANVVYDSTQHNFRVTVQDNYAGQLLVKVENLTAQTATEFLSSVDTSVAFTNAIVTEAAKKEVVTQADATTNIDGDLVEAGDVLTYYITYVNYTGKDVVVDILDTIPQHTTYVEGSASHDATFAAGHLNWTLHVLKGESVTVFFSVTVNDEEGTVSNTAVIRDGVNTYKTNEVTNEIPENPVPDIPQTDDNSRLSLGVAMMILSGMAMAVTLVLSKKRVTE